MSESETSKLSLFDAAGTFQVEIISGARRICRTSFPPDAAWIERHKKIRTYRHDIGRGKTRSESTHLETIDEAFLTPYLLEGSEPLDNFELSVVVQKLMRAEPSLPQLEGESGDQVRILLTVFGGVETEHVLQTPRRKHIIEYGREALKVTGGKDGVEVRTYLEPAARYYDLLHVSVTGYAEGSRIPVIHKDVVFQSLMDLSNPEA